jgi:hypothetical protein
MVHEPKPANDAELIVAPAPLQSTCVAEYPE